MLTPDHVIAAFALLDRAGVRRPDHLIPPEQGRNERDDAYRARAQALVRDVAETYAAVLADLDPDVFRGAVLGWLRQATPFWPTPGQLLQAAPERKAATIDEADEAWGQVLDIARRHGLAAGTQEARPRWLDPNNPWRTPERVTAMWAGISACGGWRSICQEEDPTVKAAHRAAFRGAYRSSIQRGAVLVEATTVRAITSGPTQAQIAAAPPMLRAVMGADPDPHAGTRAWRNAAERAR